MPSLRDTTFCNSCIWGANGSSCRSKRMAKAALRSITRASTALGAVQWLHGRHFVASVLKLDQDGLLDTTVIHGDGTTTAAKKGGDKIGFSGHKKVKGDQVVAFCDRHCNVIAPFVSAPGNRNESPLLREALPQLTGIAQVVGLNLQDSIISLDGVYDCRRNREAIFNRGMIPNINPNARWSNPTEAWPQAALRPRHFFERFRTIERVFAWEDKFRRLLLRFD
jgi:hypothetical protein